MGEQMKIAVIADIIASKKMDNRARLQEVLDHILEEINTQFSNQIESNLTVTLGDEFQGIIGDCYTAFLVIDLIDTKLKLETKKQLNEEASLRWGIGIGDILTPIKDKTISIGTDGPAYWNARAAIERVHSENDYGETTERVETNTEVGPFWNSIIKLQNTIRNDWTTTQQETAYTALNVFGYEEINNQRLKQQMNQSYHKSFSEQTISKRIKSTHIKQYSQSRKQLAEQIEQWRSAYDY
ncbi:SatD family protein [Marinilactibacillus piezotolerans]|uniref:SatD family protein n=1 Tax=Marinilactibacillus piezotolerans TaxID=258723 RepID=UPI0009B010AB|nr:SatD family protein [Marinilactibacillus piezotolerans]